MLFKITICYSNRVFVQALINSKVRVGLVQDCCLIGSTIFSVTVLSAPFNYAQIGQPAYNAPSMLHELNMTKFTQRTAPLLITPLLAFPNLCVFLVRS